MTAVLHVEPRDIVNYANPDYYWQYDSPEVQELIAAAKVNPDPDEADRAAQGGGPADLRGLAGRLADPRRRPHRVDDRTSPATRPTTPARGSTPRGSRSTLPDAGRGAMIAAHDAVRAAAPRAAARGDRRRQHRHLPAAAAAAGRPGPGHRRHRRRRRSGSRRSVEELGLDRPARAAVPRLDGRHPARRLRHVGAQRRDGHQPARHEADRHRAARAGLDRAVGPRRRAARHRRRRPPPPRRRHRPVGRQPARHRRAVVLGRAAC